MLNENLQNFWGNTQAPWGKLFYKIVWTQLNLNNMTILDFGSGFGIMANYLAKNNNVTAIEPNSDIVESNERMRENDYTQIIGSLDKLKEQSSDTFDAVICHNVFEYVEASERADILKEFSRILKNDGILSIVKHNKPGKIFDEVVFNNNLDEALALLDGGTSASKNFGTIDYYDAKDLTEYFEIEKILGIKAFYGLPPNDIKFDEDWQEKIFEIEMKAADIEIYKNVAFFNHVILRNIKNREW